MGDVLYKVEAKAHGPLQPEHVEQATFYRFRIDGVAAAIAIADRFQASNLRWDSVRNEHGSETTLRAHVEGHEGAVRFVVEHDHGGSWQPYAAVPGVVKDGEASAVLKIHHPVLPPDGPLPEGHDLTSAEPAQLRFRVEKA
ncbi:MAG: hypothetical protein ABR567_12805 [Myxococcales bacterium]|nr:hypothetical protein [Myxococcales bacterium]